MCHVSLLEPALFSRVRDKNATSAGRLRDGAGTAVAAGSACVGTGAGALAIAGALTSALAAGALAGLGAAGGAPNSAGRVFSIRAGFLPPRPHKFSPSPLFPEIPLG